MQPNFVVSLFGNIVRSTVELFGAWLFVFVGLFVIGIGAAVWRRLMNVG